jgi:hypothetical protein
LVRVETSDQLRAKAHNCRQLARTADEHTAANLEMLGAAYEAQAARLDLADEAGPEPVSPSPAASQ